ncbi:5-oxoprolinase subunit PxpA [Corticimicrobacter populi]|uniref:5-oxoprolinase subunit A n=1 Tax=Corticimicrobacter populi TaxID=2175229 RepID=A0A2V1K194_9BURK|nr:5-oxoprolinase subunit PxpA [Corticimicrobacter populi]PWF21762.1 LamB/YcsF family protein [Corticimicrobacter populi]
MQNAINLNADLGESFGAWNMGLDEALLQVIDSANIACGFHAGDPVVMRRTVRAAKAAGVEIGAHPSFPDLQGFGRRRMHLAPDELEAALLYQIAALDGMARTEETRVTHVKVHGALSNMACDDAALATVVAHAIRTYGQDLILLAPACSQLCLAGRAAGLRVVEEIFADRAYTDAGQLVPRSRPDAMIHGAAASLAHVEAMLQAGALISTSGKHIPTPIGSICVHGDGPDAVNTAAALKQALGERGYHLRGMAA